MLSEHKNIMFGVIQQEFCAFICCMLFDLRLPPCSHGNMKDKVQNHFHEVWWA